MFGHVHRLGPSVVGNLFVRMRGNQPSSLLGYVALPWCASCRMDGMSLGSTRIWYIRYPIFSRFNGMLLQSNQCTLRFLWLFSVFSFCYFPFSSFGIHFIFTECGTFVFDLVFLCSHGTGSAIIFGVFPLLYTVPESRYQFRPPSQGCFPYCLLQRAGGCLCSPSDIPGPF